MSTTFRPPFPLPSLGKPHTSVCDLNIRNTREELHNFVDEVHCMLSFILHVIVKLIAFISIHLYFLTLYPDEHEPKPTSHHLHISFYLKPKTTSHHQTLQPSYSQE